MTTPELRAAHNAVQGPVSAFYTSIALNENLWKAVKAVDESGEKRKLAPVHQRYLHKTVTGFRRAGADLDAGRQESNWKNSTSHLTKATTKFSENVLDATNAYEFLITDENQARGLAGVGAAGGARERSIQGQGRLAAHLTRAELHRRADVSGRP